MPTKPSLTELLEKSLEEARTGDEPGPRSRELEELFAIGVEFIFKSKGFKWEGWNWKMWKGLAQGNAGYDHVVVLDAGWPQPKTLEDVMPRYSIVIAGPKSESAPWSISTGFEADGAVFIKYLESKYELTPANRYQPTAEQVCEAATRAHLKGR